MRGVAAVLLALVLLAMPGTAPTASAAPIAHDAFWRTWARTDQPVAEGRVSRTWMWGAKAAIDPLLEAYAETPGGRRLVQYFDKARMEISDPGADPASLWYVTNGLLAKELLTGQMQVGGGAFRQHEPARIQVAGDPGPDAPTYAIFNTLMRSPALPVGSTIIQTLDNEGKVGTYRLMSEHGVTAAVFVDATKHSVASVFWEFMNASGLVLDGNRYAQDKLFEDPFYATGYPLTEAYWMTVRVGGRPKQVLVQVFERRVLTYAPDNPDGWKVEAGNVGQHYFAWRYGQLGYGFCSTLAEPSVVTSQWWHPDGAVAQIASEMNLIGRVALFWQERAFELRNAYHLITAEPGCFNASTELFYPWLRIWMQTGPSITNYSGHLRQQIRVAVEQPNSLIGQKIRQIEQGRDRLRPETGPDAYWEYLFRPMAQLTMHPVMARALEAAFNDASLRYKAVGWESYPDFGAYLVGTGALNRWLL